MNFNANYTGSYIAIIILLLGMDLIGQGRDDPELTMAVEEKLFVQEQLKDNNIEVASSGNVITLTGSVDNIREKRLATEMAGSIRGVTGIVNELMIITSDIPDPVIEAKLEEALEKDPAVSQYQIKTSVNDGKVVLEGDVDSWQANHLTQLIAEDIVGVLEVKNKLDFLVEDRPENEIKEDIMERLRNNVAVDNDLINVKVNGNTVTLSGKVASAPEKEKARKLAFVTGVKKVKNKDIKVKKGERNDEMRKYKYASRTDQEIALGVENEFKYQPRLKDLEGEIHVEDGIVTLKGAVNNLKAKRVAEQITRNIPGVMGVNNHLDIKPKGDRELLAVAVDVRNALERDPDLEEYNIEVAGFKQKIHLNGAVDNYFEKYLAEDITARIDGVVAIANNIEVRKDESRLSIKQNGQNFMTEEALYRDRYQEPSKNDLEVKKSIERLLWWSPFVDVEAITIKVNNGLVTLIGTVATQLEKRKALENAFNGGAVAVDNQIEVVNKYAGESAG